MGLRDIDLMIASLVVSVVAFSSFIFYLGEENVDAYVAVSILLYYLTTGFFESIRRKARLIYTDILFAILFLAITAYRIIVYVLG